MVTTVTAFSIFSAFSNCLFCSIQCVAASLGPSMDSIERAIRGAA